ncbi:MAG: CBS domain-containing protein, partial [Nitrospiraceae bacterium]
MVTAQKLMKQDLAKVQVSSPVSDAAKVMRERKIGSVFVEQNDRIVGIVTETDIVRQIVGRDQMPGFVPVASIMSSPVIGIDGARPIT